MTLSYRYDVTDWPVGDPAEDIGAVINSMIADIKRRQTDAADGLGGKPGAVICIPPGDYRLRTQVRIDVSFLRIEGSGHGFTSSSIRFNVPEQEWPSLHELWPGGSRVLVDLPVADSTANSAAFLIEREGDPRLSSIEFSGFCIDGLHFEPDGTDLLPANTYVNGKVGIFAATANDSVRINGMGLVYLEHALLINHADALSIHDNFIAECGSCIELRGWGQASKITDNLIGAGPRGHSIYVENHGGLLVSSNNVFPRGDSSVHFSGVSRSSITGNRLHTFYPGALRLIDGSTENLVSANHILRDYEPWTPFLEIDNGVDDDYGIVRIDGTGNSIIANHVSENVDAQRVRPANTRPVIIRVAGGTGNYIATNHVVALNARTTSADSAYAAQVDALLTTHAAADLPVTTVQVDASSTHNTILDSGSTTEVLADLAQNAFRPTPGIGSFS